MRILQKISHPCRFCQKKTNFVRSEKSYYLSCILQQICYNLVIEKNQRQNCRVKKRSIGWFSYHIVNMTENNNIYKSRISFNDKNTMAILPIIEVTCFVSIKTVHIAAFNTYSFFLSEWLKAIARNQHTYDSAFSEVQSKSKWL